MASTLRLDFLRDEKEYASMSNIEIARDLAQKYHYIAVIKFDDMGPNFACCLTVNELEEVLGSPRCYNREVIYCVSALESALLPLQAQGILKMANTEASAGPAKTKAPAGQKKWWQFWK